MKKTSLFLVAFAILIIRGNCQDFKVGIRFNPLNSQYWADELLIHGQSQFSQDKNVSRFDSLTIGIFVEKYFTKKAFLVRMDINYADLKILYLQNSNDVNPFNNSINEYTQVNKQKYININLGIGTHTNWNKFIFTFGIYVPFTIMDKGTITRDANSYSYGTLTQNTKCTGTYKPALGAGIGAFAGVNTIILKHLSIGLDVSYQIEYLSRKFTWHGETHYYGSNPYDNINDETSTERNYFTSKIMPSIVIAYAFDIKKKESK
jgi:hypothetical protein